MRERPLSPHLQIYRLPLTALLSISHRISGVYLTVGMIVWVVCLLAVADSEAAFAVCRSGLSSVPGQFFLWLWNYALLFHLCHGVRHLIWDTGHGFAPEDLTRYAWLELLASLGLFLLVAAARFLQS